MIGMPKVKKLVSSVLRDSRADQVEVTVFNSSQALTRFANNYIHQNVQEANTSVSIRSVFGKKVGYAMTNSLETGKIREAQKWSEAIAKLQRDNPDLANLPRSDPRSYKKAVTYKSSTAGYTSDKRAAAVQAIVGVAARKKLKAFGSVSNGSAEIAIGNSAGTFAYNTSADIFCNIVMSTDTSSGYVQSGSRDVSALDFEGLAKTAADKALLSMHPAECIPGKHTTIFEPLAMADLLGYLAYYAFNGKLYEEGRSFLAGKLKTRVVSSSVTLTDDPFNAAGFAIPFDFEGVPKKKIVLIEKGIARNVVYDSLTAGRARKTSTGHALTAPNPFGPIPVNLVMEGGRLTVDDLIKKTGKGILVTRLHYTNVIDPYKLNITGMTRDGTFLIENGTITRGLKNLRFTENVFRAFKNIDGTLRADQKFHVHERDGILITNNAIKARMERMKRHYE
jgi:PmbA protein